MIGLVLVTHGRLAVEFRAALEHVVGPQGQIEAVTIGPDDDVEERRKDIIEAVEGPINLNVCLEDSNVCSLQPRCRMFRVWEHGQRVLLEVFSQSNLQQVASSQMPMAMLATPPADADSATAMLKA